MRLNYYVFPETATAHLRWKNGAELLNGECKKGFSSCRQCVDTYETCDYFTCTESEVDLKGISITAVKDLVKSIGGTGYIEHVERDGTVIGYTEVRMNQNNSRFKYNRHL